MIIYQHTYNTFPRILIVGRLKHTKTVNCKNSIAEIDSVPCQKKRFIHTHPNLLTFDNQNQGSQIFHFSISTNEILVMLINEVFREHSMRGIN